MPCLIQYALLSVITFDVLVLSAGRVDDLDEAVQSQRSGGNGCGPAAGQSHQETRGTSVSASQGAKHASKIQKEKFQNESNCLVVT